MNQNSNHSNSNYFSMKAKSSFKCRPSSGDKKCPLKSDKCQDNQNSLIEMALVDLRRVRLINSRICEPSTDQNSLILQRFLQSFRNSALDEAKSSSFKMIEDVNLLQKIVDDKLMDDVLDYMSILRREMNSNSKKLSLNSADCGRRKRQAKRLRNVIIFSRYIQIETQGAVTLTSIEPDSSQWARCQKAVAENLNISGMESAGYSKVTVMNAFKLEHKMLSRCIQDVGCNAAESLRVKGLFVFLRKDELYGFCAYGLHAQKHNKKRMIPNIKQSSTLPGLFQLPWFCAELSTSNESHCIREKSTSTVNNINEIHGFVDIEGNLNKRGYAEILAEGNTDLDLYFSKFSNPHHPLIRNDGLKQDREEDYNTFIVLCRVLIDKMVVLDGDVTLEDVEMAIESGHDAIYSRSRKEYVLLNPEHVLPEFLLQYEYTCVEVKGITSKPSSIPADKAPGDDLRENSCNGTSIPCPIAYIQRNSDSSHGRGSDSGRSERSKPDSRSISLPIKNSKVVDNDNKGVLAKLTEKANILSCRKKGKELQNRPHTTKGEELRNMAESDCSALFDKQDIIHRVRNARKDFITKRNESLKLDCVPFL